MVTIKIRVMVNCREEGMIGKTTKGISEDPGSDQPWVVTQCSLYKNMFSCIFVQLYFLYILLVTVKKKFFLMYHKFYQNKKTQQEYFSMLPFLQLASVESNKTEGT